MRFPRSLARYASRRPWRILVAWMLVLAASSALIGGLLGGVLTQESRLTHEPEAERAAQLLEQRLRGPERATEVFIVSSTSLTVDEPRYQAFVEDLHDRIVGLGPEHVVGVQTYYETGDDRLVSEDRKTTILPTALAVAPEDAEGAAAELAAVAGAGDGFTVRVFGPASLASDFTKVLEHDLQTGEAVGLLAAVLVLVVVFGAIVAAVLPILVGIAAITVAIGLVALLGQWAQFSFIVTNITTMMGLAVGIDYSLFIVSRYREERAKGSDKFAAIEAAGASSSVAVFFSGMTVILALVGMLIIPSTIFRSVAAGAILVVLASVAASLTLLPALLGLLGDRVDAWRVRRSTARRRNGSRVWEGLSHVVMRRPVLSVVMGVAILLAAASSALDMRTGFSGVSTLPDGFAAKQAFEVLASDFPGGMSSPVEIVVDGPVEERAVAGAIERLQELLAGDTFLGPSQLTVNPARDLALLQVPLMGDPTEKAAGEAVERVRDEYIPSAFGSAVPADVLVGGESAFNNDFFEVTDRYMPIVFALVLGLSFCLLTIAFRSVVVPVKAIVLNLLSVGAAYGLIVLVSQKGFGAGILGFQQVDVIEAWLPLFLFCVLFGLSMDYHVFLLSRIRERYGETGDNAGSVAYGLSTTAGIITGAALIMVAVFAGFAAGELVMFQQMGFGLGVAVLLDATLVRSVLVPASMKLLGAKNWYLPRWLDWLPDLSLEGRSTPALAPPGATASTGGAPADTSADRETLTPTAVD